MYNADPKCGETYIFTTSFYIPSGLRIEVGDKLFLIEPTGQNPHGYFDYVTGHNWTCKGPNGVTVWSTVPWAIDLGYLVLDK